LRYAIEAKELTTQQHRPSQDVDSRRTVIEANDPDDAISQFVLQDDSELLSLSQPSRGRESIATVRKKDTFYLVRVSAA
jgi:hypothetical protein